LDDLDNASSDLSRQDIEKNQEIDLPEALVLIQEIGYPDNLPYPGSWIEQPFIMMQELREAARATDEFKKVKARNARLKREALQRAGGT
jgi:hypothetical protein